MEYKQQSSAFSRFLSWLPLKQQCNLRAQIDHDEYPPCIHMDLKYDDPSVKPEVDTTLKISCRRPIDCMPFSVNVPGEHLSLHWTLGMLIHCVSNVLSYIPLLRILQNTIPPSFKRARWHIYIYSACNTAIPWGIKFVITLLLLLAWSSILVWQQLRLDIKRM